MLSELLNFVKNDIWRVRLRNYPPAKSFWIRQLRIVLLAIRGYDENKCNFRASALTFYSLLSIVPVIAMMFGIAKGFGLEKNFEAQILKSLQGQEEVAKKIITFANSLLANTNGGLIAGIGVILVLWTVIQVLSNIENSFNDIWGVKKPRHLGRKFTDYLSIMMICPFLLIAASSITVMISSQVQHWVEAFSFLRSYGWIILPSLKLLSYIAIWVTFTFVFIFMPNTKVKLKSGIFAGIITGTIFLVVQWVYINFQIGAVKYGPIYGSFAALPLFLLWLQSSWLIVLFGAELSFAHQNVDTYEFEQDCLSVSHSFKTLISLLICQLVVKNFCESKQAWDAAGISHKLNVPIRLVREILYELVESGVVCEIRQEEDKDVAYQPACDVGKLTVKYVVDSLEHRGNTNIPVITSAELDKLSSCLKTFADTIEKSPANTLLKDI